jgi:hypothetical protein
LIERNEQKSKENLFSLLSILILIFSIELFKLLPKCEIQEMLGRHSEVIRNKAFVKAAEKAFGFRHLYENVKNVSIPQPSAVTSDWLIEHASCSLKFIFFVKKR